MDKITVLVCDDSALMRNLISRIINENDGMTVGATAMNGRFALEKLSFVKPDVIVLDIEMPEMNGIEFLKVRRERGIDIPVIILSSIATKGAGVTMQCLELGASDFITKPGSSVTADISTVADLLIEMIASYGGTYASKNGKKVQPPEYFMHQTKLRNAEKFVAQQKGLPVTADKTQPQTVQPVLFMAPVPKEPAVIEPVRSPGRIEVIAIGISTGGPNALRDVFSSLDPELTQPVLVVQHMPAGFTAEFANSLSRICPLPVTEVKDGELLRGAHVYIAPGNFHIYVEKQASGTVIRTSQEAQRNGHRPSADVLFESVAKIYRNNALGIIMTGMGRDGAAQLAVMRKEGAWTLGQEEKSCVVYGMPKAAWELGAVQKQVSLSQMASEINRLAKENR